MGALGSSLPETLRFLLRPCDVGLGLCRARRKAATSSSLMCLPLVSSFTAYHIHCVCLLLRHVYCTLCMFMYVYYCTKAPAQDRHNLMPLSHYLMPLSFCRYAARVVGASAAVPFILFAQCCPPAPPLPPPPAVLLAYPMTAVHDGRVGAKSDLDFCERLAEEKAVVCTPLSVFYLPSDMGPSKDGEGTTCRQPGDTCMLVRFTICKSRDYILAACRALEHDPGKTN